MRNEYYDEHEQGEAVKKWLKDNGASILMGVALGVGALFGWRYWQQAEETGKLDAAYAYERLLMDVDEGAEPTRELLERFYERHENEAYATLAALQLATRATGQQNYQEAIALLEFAVSNGQPPSMRPVAGLRLARLQLQTGQLSQALATVDRFDDNPFDAAASEIRGDILLAQGERAAAREAYEYALDNFAGGDRALLQMKIDDLAVADNESTDAT